jgi:hypothetical protein
MVSIRKTLNYSNHSTMSVSYEIPNFQSTDEGFVHSRPLGTKVQGLYQNVSWSDVALQGVPLDRTLELETQDMIIGFHQDISNTEETEENEIAKEPSSNSVKKIVVLGGSEFKKGDKPKHVKSVKPIYENHPNSGEWSRVDSSGGLVKRPIPKHQPKNYTTKPRSKEGRHPKYEKYVM